VGWSRGLFSCRRYCLLRWRPFYHSNPLPPKPGWAVLYPHTPCAELLSRVALTHNSPATFMYPVVRRRPLNECIGSAVASVASSEKDAPVGIRAFWQAAQDVRATALAASSTGGTSTKRVRRSNKSIIQHGLLRAFHHFLSGASWAVLSFAAPPVRVHVCVRRRWFWRSAGRRSHGSLSAGSHGSVATLNNSRGDTTPGGASNRRW